MLDLTNYIQILHNLLCASVCHFRRLLAHLHPETRPTQTRDPRGSAASLQILQLCNFGYTRVFPKDTLKHVTETKCS